MVVYYIKLVLRGESPKEKREPYVDMLWSLAFPPSIKPGMRTTPRSVFFRPNNGRLFPPTEENITAVK